MSDTTAIQLKKLVRKLSYREGDFTLASGQKSKFYIDLKCTTLHPEGAQLLGRLMVERVKAEGLLVDGVGGMTLGADPMATAVSLAALEKGLVWPAYIVRKEPKDHGTAKYVEGTENLPAGAKLLVLEDVVTTGGSSVKAIERLREAGYKPVAVFTVVDRQSGGREVFEKMGVKFLSLFTLQEIQSP
ncbi:orotate phosphoribosyltransferase [bacterium]|jgi:orotate phosphoribosyltransferase|nr:orotate phosphoribosyltransferase [bacterium]